MANEHSFMSVLALKFPVYAETMRFLIDRLGESGYQVLLGESGFTTESEEKLILAILSRRPDAIFLTGTVHSSESRRRLLNARIPVIETWDITPTPLDVVIGFSHEKEKPTSKKL